MFYALDDFGVENVKHFAAVGGVDVHVLAKFGGFGLEFFAAGGSFDYAGQGFVRYDKFGIELFGVVDNNPVALKICRVVAVA